MDNKKTLEEYNFKLGKELIEEGATYASVILLNKQAVLYNYSTNKTWDNLYHQSGHSKSCHLIQAAKKLYDLSSNFTLIWDLILPTDEISQYLNCIRNENNICHGISFCHKNNNGILEVITLAGRCCDFNFSKQVIEDKEKIFKNVYSIQSKMMRKASYFL